MIGRLLKPTLALTALLTVAMTVIHGSQVDDGQVEAFVTAPENCGGSCLIGIRPGETTVDEAMAHLAATDWTTAPQLNASGQGYGQIRWDWSGAQPAIIDETHLGRITFYWDEEEPNSPGLGETRIETISIYTNMRMYSLQTWYGQPDTGSAAFRFDEELVYSAAYHRDATMTGLSTVLPCPVTLLTYWEARARITMSVGRGSSIFLPPAEMARMC